MPDIDSLLEKSSKKKFKKSSYRPWNYLEEIEKEEGEKQQEPESAPALINAIVEPITIIENKPSVVQQDEVQNKANPIEKIIAITPPTQVVTVFSDQEANEKHVSPLYSILRLSGHQKTIFVFILEKCLSRGSLSSGVVTSDMLINITNTSLSMVNTSIQRLVDKKLICRENGKRGRGGFYCFGLSQEVKEAAIEYRRLATLDNTEGSKNENQFENSDLSSLDNRKYAVLPKEWEEIDAEPLSHIGFSRGHLVQLYKHGSIDFQTMQDSIYHFAYDLDENNKAAGITKSSPIGYFMGILKRAGLYNAPQNYESPKDKALREMIERKKAEKEKRESMIKELINIAFDDWQSKLSQEEKDNFIPEDVRKSRLSGAKLASLKAYFVENIWPQVSPKEAREKTE
jgi:hypothetical protein